MDRDDVVQGYLAHKKHSFPQDYYGSLGIGLLQGPRGGSSYRDDVVAGVEP